MTRSFFPVALLLALACSLPPGSKDDDLLTSGKKLYSQFNEELIIRHFFEDRRNGFFVDVGAYQWKDMSTTYYLEEHLGWSGIAVDAIAEYGKGYAEHRPRTKFFAYIVTDHSGTEEKFYVSVGSEGLSSTSKDWIVRFFEVFWPQAQPKIREIRVPTMTLNELLDKNRISAIDFLSMDIEGGEPAALAGFDINRFKPELVCIESSPINREKIAVYFTIHGYERVEEYLEHDSVNWYYKPKVRDAST
jgi:FkbM family methyltransferase